MRSYLKSGLRKSIPFLLVLLCALTAFGQLPEKATVGVPYTLDTTFGLYNLIQQDAAEYAAAGISVAISFSATGALPPGLTYSPVGILSGTPTTAGTYTVAVQVSETITSPELTFGPYVFPFLTYTINVSGGTGPAVTATPGSLSFSLTAGAGASTQTISVSNRSGTAATFQASATGGSFLTVTGGGSLPAFGSGSLAVTANPSSLAAGTYTGAISISGSFPGSPLRVPVIVTVTSQQPILSLSQTGLFFRAGSGGPPPPAQSFSVSNVGAGSLNFVVAASTLSGGPWLSASPATGVANASLSPQVTVLANPAGLAAGTYYGQLQIAANGVPNSPQLVSVVLNVAAAATNLDPDVRPTALIFVGKQGGTSPPAKPVVITNIASAAANFSSSIAYVSSATGWLSVTPAMGTIASGKPSSPMVSASQTKLAPGIYVGQVSFAFTEAKTIHNIAVVFIVLPAGSVASPEIGALQTGGREAGGCTPTQLLPVFSSLGQSFTTSAAWPSQIEITAVDDCGTPMTTGSIITSFSSGDAPISLTSLNDGRWSGTWTPQNAPTTTVSITATAQSYAPSLAGTTSIGGTSNSNPGIPKVQSGGVVNAASNAASTPVAPGSYISIYGSSLASGLTVATAPFPTTLGGTQVFLGGQAIPLYFTSDGQINALVPYGMPTNATSQILVSSAGAYSTPQAVTLADGGPGVFLNAQGAGIVVGVKPDGTQYLVGASTPTTGGDALVIYCAGLGDVNQQVNAGAVSPGSPLAVASNNVTVTIEGIPATVLYAGLAPGFAGLYQVNVVVPSGLTTSAAAPLVITAAGQASPPAPIAVQQ
jgi:uncharacterized protein (TIGR03437 family)